MELKLTVDGLEKERDFYFSKLRDIELICQEHESENNPVLSKIIDILYATEVNIRYRQQIQASLHHLNLQVPYSEGITIEDSFLLVKKFQSIDHGYVWNQGLLMEVPASVRW